MITEHVAAVKALLPVDLTVHDDEVPSSPSYPYVALWYPAGLRPGPKLCNTSDNFSTRLFVTHVGLTRASVRIITKKVRDALLDVRPTVAGRTCWKLRIDDSQPIRPDTDITLPDTDTHPQFAVDVWRLASAPA